MKRTTRLTVTQLEDRSVPATFGYTWVNPGNITFSIVPDGTDVAGLKSNLQATLNATMSQSAWTTEIQNAFQAWVNVAGINVSQTGDNGAALGGSAPLQGSPLFGDIRISARPLSDNVMAITNPPDLMSPWAGEIILNSNKVFTIDGANGTAALRRVLLQETGHALGLGNSTDERSVMYEYGGSQRIDAADVAAIQSLYGPAVNDAYEGTKGNNTVGSAAPLGYITSSDSLTFGDVDSSGQLLVARAALTSGDVDYYTFKQPSGTTTALVSVQSTGLSMLRARVQVFDSDGQLVKTATPSAWSNNVTLLLSNLAPGKSYSVRVDAEPGTAFAVGGYRIGVGSPLATLLDQASATMTDAGGIARSVVLGEDNGTATASNDTIRAATDLGKVAAEGSARWDVNVASQFATATDVDVYKVRTLAGTPSVMLVAAWSTAGADPEVTVTTADGQVLKATVLTNTASTNIIQIEGIKAKTDYYISIRAKSFGSGTSAKSYRFGVDFRTSAIVQTALAAGTLTSQTNQIQQTLTVTRSEGFQFTLSSTNTADTVQTAARLTVFDATGKAVFTTVAKSGETVTGFTLLQPATYTIVIAGATVDGSPLKGLKVDARFVATTDPIGPMLADDYTAPPTTTTTETANTTTTTADAGYFLLTPATLGTGFLAPTDPYSSPWW
ncbi:MAG: matrixin family metalloprotease [Planctomycetes bacterium]|nr:matrixin family metalloprotease [Planctomycetota bacterium]